MYLEIVEFGRENIVVKFHEGILHNKKFRISIQMFAALFYKCKLPIGSSSATNLHEMLGDRLVVMRTEEEQKFYNELINNT